MNTETTEPRWKLLDCGPDELFGVDQSGGADFILLPRDYAESGTVPVYTNSTRVLRKLLNQAGFRCNLIGSEGTQLFLEQRSATWVAPVMFVSAAALASSPEMMSVALGVISNYITSFLQKGERRPQIHVEVITQRSVGHSYRKATYEGDAEGLRHLPDTWIDGPEEP